MLFDMDKISEQDTYKLLISTVVPRPIAWVVSQDTDGLINAAPFSFFNAVSGNPPIVTFGIGGRAPGDAKDTGNNIRQTGQFVVNLVNNATAEAMNITAIDFPHGVNELREAGLTLTPSTKVRPPRIAESPVAMECERLITLDVADNRTIVLGRVVAIHIADDCVLDPVKCYVDTPKLDLIGRMHGGGWYTKTTDRFEMKRIDLDGWNRRS